MSKYSGNFKFISVWSAKLKCPTNLIIACLGLLITDTRLDAHWNILDSQNISWASAYGNLIASSATNWDSLYPDHTGMKWKSLAGQIKYLPTSSYTAAASVVGTIWLLAGGSTFWFNQRLYIVFKHRIPPLLFSVNKPQSKHFSCLWPTRLTRVI